MDKDCKICGKKFKSSRAWSKYCSDGCRKKANSYRVIEHRKKNQPLKINTLEELKNKQPYRTNYENIIRSLKKHYPFADLGGGRQKEKYIKRQEKQHIKITWSYLLKNTGLSSDSLNKYLNVMRKFGIIEKNSYELSDKFKFEPLRIFQSNIINNTLIDNVLPIGNNTFYLLCLTYKDFTEEEIKTLLSHIYKINDYYSKIEHDILKKVGERKANIIWNEFIDNIDAHKLIKFLMWLLLIRDNILDNLGLIIVRSRWSKINESNPVKNIYLYSEKMQKTVNEIYNGIIINQQKQFKIIFKKAYLNYFKKIHPDLKKLNELIKESQKKYNKKFEETIDQIRDNLMDSRLFFTTSQNELICWADIKYGYNFDKEKTNNILTSLSYAMFDHPFSKKIDHLFQNLILERINSLKNKSIEKELSKYIDITKFKTSAKNITLKNKKINSYSTFFSDIDFFSGFEKELETKINCNKKELYKQMDRYGNIFKKPEII